MTRKTKKQILIETDGGVGLFQLLLPDLEMIGGKNKTNINSPISKGKGCFSVFRYRDKYLYKDHYTKEHGDIFEMIARMNSLNSKNDFIKVIEIIEKLLNANSSAIPEIQQQWFINDSTGDELCVVREEFSKSFLSNHFMPLLPYLERTPSYTINLVKYFTLKNVGIVSYEFDYSKPKEAFYALVIIPNEYYILFNPKTMISYAWGHKPEYYLFGMDNLFRTAYTQNIYLRDTLVFTNKVEGVLWCEDKGIPCVSLLEDEAEVPQFFTEVILPRFPYKFLMLGLLKDNKKLRHNLIQVCGFTNIITGEIYLNQFFKQGEKTIERIFENFEYSDGFEYEGIKSPVREISTIGNV